MTSREPTPTRDDFFHERPQAVEHAIDVILTPREPKRYPSRRKPAAGWLARLAARLNDAAERARAGTSSTASWRTS